MVTMPDACTCESPAIGVTGLCQKCRKYPQLEKWTRGTDPVKHTHRPIPSEHKAFSWTHCVAKGPCSGCPHGSIVLVDRCKCGAVRRVESNGRHSASSGWVKS